MTPDFADPFTSSTHQLLAVEYGFVNITFRGLKKTFIDFKPFDIAIEPRAMILKKKGANTVFL